jgi:hypothetical protein
MGDLQACGDIENVVNCGGASIDRSGTTMSAIKVGKYEREREEARRNSGHVGPPSQWPIRRQLRLTQMQRKEEGLI